MGKIRPAPAPGPAFRLDARHDTISVRRALLNSDWDRLIGEMKGRRVSGFDACGQMTDAALDRLSHLDHVTRLRLGGSQQLTDAGLRHLARMPQLEELDLSEYPGGALTDRGLEVLRHLPALRKFHMCWQKGISDAGAANLESCDRLESVDLMGTHTGDGAVAALRGKSALRRFKTGRLVTDEGLALLHDFPAFRTWQGGDLRYSLMSFDVEPTHLLVDGPFTNHDLGSLSGLEGLFGLSFFWHTSQITPDGLRSLVDMGRLGFLGCPGPLCDDTAMQHIAAMPRLRMLMAQGTVATDDGFDTLARSATVEYIWGRECPHLTGRGFAALSRMPALRGLAVSCKHVGSAALSLLPRFPSLKELLPMDVDDAGFRHVGGCGDLDGLWCMYCRETTDRATEHLKNLTKLRTYYAGATQITDRSLELLERLASLERIELYECKGVTNDGLPFIARLPRLREVALSGLPGVTLEGTSVFPASVDVDYSM